MEKFFGVLQLQKILLFFLLVSFSVLILMPLQKELDRFMVSLKRDTIDGLEREIGRELRYEKISPSILLSLNIHDVRVSPPNEGRPDTIEIGRLRVFYSPMDILRGKTVSAVREIEITNSTIIIDEELDAEFLDRLGRLTRGKAAVEGEEPIEKGRSMELFGTTFARITLTGKNLLIKYKGKGNISTLSRLFFTLDFPKESHNEAQFTSRGSFSFFSEKPIELGNFAFANAETDFSLESTMSERESPLLAVMSLKNFSSDLFSFDRLTVELQKDEEKTVLRKIEDRSPWNFSLSHIQDEGLFKLEFAAEEFAFSDKLRLGEELTEYRQLISSRLSGTMDAEIAEDLSTYRYTADLTAQIDHQAVPEPFTATIDLKGDENSAVFEALELQSESLDLAYYGEIKLNTFFPQGKVELRRLTLGGHTYRSDITLRSSPETVEFRTDRIFIDSSLELRAVSLDLRKRGNQYDYRSSLFLSADGIEEQIDNYVRSEGSFTRGENPGLELSAEITDLPLVPILQIYAKDFPVERVPLKNARLTTEAFVSKAQDGFFFSLQPLKIEDVERGFSLFTRVRGNNELIRFGEIEILYHERSLYGNANMAFAEQDTVHFDAALRMAAEQYDIYGTYHGKSTLIIRGNHGISASAFFQRNNVAFSAKADNLPVPIGEESSELSFKGRGRISKETGWLVHLSSLEILSPPGLQKGGSIRISASANRERIKLWDLRYSDSVSILTGEGVFIPDNFDEPSGSGWLTLRSEQESALRDKMNREEYSAVCAIENNRIKASVTVNSMPLRRFAVLPIDGILSADAFLSGPIDDPELDFSAQLEEGEYRNTPLEFDLRASVNKRVISLNYIQGSFKNHLIQKGEGRYNVERGRARIEGDYLGTIGKKSSSAHFVLDAALTPVAAIENVAEVFTSNFSAELDLTKINLFGTERASWNVGLEREEGTIQFIGGPKDAVSGQFNDSGEFSISVDDPLPVRFLADGRIEEGTIATRVHDVFFDLTTLDEIGFDAILFNSGSIRGGFTITGSAADPEFYGTLQGSRIAGTLEQVAEPVEQFSTTITMDDKEVRVEPVSVRSGKGRASLSGGFVFDKWTPTDIQVLVRTLDENGIHVVIRLKESGLSIDGYGTGDFSFTSGFNENRIGGDILAKDCVITLEEPQKGEKREMKKPLIVDMEIETGTKVEFIWPRRRLPILSAFADIGQKVEIFYSSLDENFRFTGEVDIRGGEIFYFQRNFFLKEGTITFNETEQSFDPLLNARAEIKEIDMTGHPVTIYLIVENEPLKSFTPRFEASPQLSTVEIAQILGTHIYGAPGEGELGLAAALMLTGDIFSQFSVVRSFENQVKEAFNLDLFSLRTQIVQNVLLERIGTEDDPVEQTEDPIQQTDPLGRYLDNTTLFLGKYLGNDLFLEAMLQVRQQPSYIGEIQDENLIFSMEVGLEWKTPLFLLNLSVNPDFTDPEQSLENTSVGLSWDYSY